MTDRDALGSTMNKDDAIKINDLVENMISLANQVLYIANNQRDEASREKSKRALAFVVTKLDLEILEPIYQAFPELRPPGMVPVRTS
jgi:hypothetical protein